MRNRTASHWLTKPHDHNRVEKIDISFPLTFKVIYLSLCYGYGLAILGYIHTKTLKNIMFVTFTLNYCSVFEALPQRLLDTLLAAFLFENLRSSVGGQKLRLLETMAQTPTFTSWLGLISHNVSFPDSSQSYHVTLRWKGSPVFQACWYGRILFLTLS